MKSGLSFKSVVLTFLVVLGLYLASFYGIEFWRQNKGPWEVTFTTDSQGNPGIVVYQPKLNISSVEILFPGEKTLATNRSQRVIFDRPLKTIPFGQRIHEDLTSLPGVETLDLFGHEIELLPRTLIVNRKEIPWKSEMVIELAPTNRIPNLPRPPK